EAAARAGTAGQDRGGCPARPDLGGAVLRPARPHGRTKRVGHGTARGGALPGAGIRGLRRPGGHKAGPGDRDPASHLAVTPRCNAWRRFIRCLRVIQITSPTVAGLYTATT